jgi:hypothetical protein
MEVPMRPLTLCAVASGLLLLAATGTSYAQPTADRAFTFSGSTVATTSDPQGIWKPNELSSYQGGPVKIFNYVLKAGDKTYIASQIWNDDCDMSTCPTRLVLETPGTSPQVLSTESEQQIIPPNDPKFEATQGLPFAKHPFYLSNDGKSLDVRGGN